MERQTIRRRRMSLNSSSQQQIVASSIQTRSKTWSLAFDFYFPDECWEFVFKFLINDGNSDGNNRFYLRCLSFVSKQFLSITNRLRFSLNISNSTRPLLPRLFQRFTKLTSLNLTHFRGDIDALLAEIGCFPLNITSLNLSGKPTIPANGLQAFSQNITTLTSLTCSFTKSIKHSDLFLIVECFPNLQMLDLRYSYDLSEEAVVHVLRTCCNIRHLNLTRCSRVKLRTLNFKVLKLENVISKSCSGFLQLLLFYCSDCWIINLFWSIGLIKC